MNFDKCIKTTELVLLSGAVPLIIGESGIGKTSLAKELSEEKNYYLVTIDGNLLKEGEIGGLPTVEDRTYEREGKNFKSRATIYATHSKLVEIDEAISQGKEVLLFIDELNRCEHAVQQELMNLILNREINGYKLSEKVKIIAAMNPSNKYDNFEQSNYEVIDMDPAQEDRFIWIELDSDVKEWIRWAMTKGEVAEEVIEFISTFPEHLHTPNSLETIKATPRSWERISKGFKVYKNNKDKFSLDIFYNLVKGNVGSNIAQDFIGFLKSLKNPIIKGKDLFKDEIISYDIREKIRKESHSRLYITAKSALNYLEEEKEIKENDINIFATLLRDYPKDLALSIMKEIKAEHSKRLYDFMLNNDEFIETFFEIYV